MRGRGKKICPLTYSASFKFLQSSKLFKNKFHWNQKGFFQRIFPIFHLSAKILWGNGISIWMWKLTIVLFYHCGRTMNCYWEFPWIVSIILLLIFYYDYNASSFIDLLITLIICIILTQSILFGLFAWIVWQWIIITFEKLLLYAVVFDNTLGTLLDNI